MRRGPLPIEGVKVTARKVGKSTFQDDVQGDLKLADQKDAETSGDEGTIKTGELANEGAEPKQDQGIEE